MTYPHDLDFGKKPSIEDANKHLYEHRQNQAVLAIMHYLRDEASYALGEASDYLTNGNQGASNFALGGHERLIQVLIKLNGLMELPPAVESGQKDEGLLGSPEIEAM